MSERIDRRLEAVYQAAGDRDTLDQLYDQWARDYDQDLWATGNPYIAITAGFVGRNVPDLDTRILDAGCGTGLLGEILTHVGYRNLVGLDASAGMLAVARRKGCYRELHELVLGEDLGLPPASFDAVTAAGVLTHGHAPPAAIDGLLDLLAPGGLMVFSLSKIAAEEEGFQEHIDELARRGAWAPVEKSELFRSYPFSEKEAHVRHWVCVYRKTGA